MSLSLYLSTPFFLSFKLKTSETGFILNDHVTQIHSSYLTNRTETKTFFPEMKNKWLQKRNKHPDVKNGGAGRALLERNTGSWHPRGRELSYGTEAQVWGTGEILIYKIDVWQIFDFDIDGLKVISIPLMTRRHQLRIHSL